MALDFWNNPIVVSAFRLRYRRGRAHLTALYVLALAAGGAVLNYYQDRIHPARWQHVYFVALISLQMAVSALRAVTATSASMKAEITQRTLDFQRIAAMSPGQILVGKLLGEPAQAYILAMSTIPLGVLCWLWGGVEFDALVLVYVQLFTTTIMFGALGLLHRIEQSEGKSKTTRGPEWLVFTFIINIFIFTPVIISTRMSVLGIPGLGALVGLATPLPAIYGIAVQDPWHYGLAFFGVEIPYLLVTPISQLAIALMCFHMMVRQLRNPLNPPWSKRTAYAILIVLDLLAAGILWDPIVGLSVDRRASAFCLFHLLASFFLMAGMTSWRESLHSWVWRIRGTRPWLRDLWLGDRSENGLALLTFCFIGIGSLFLLVTWPVVKGGTSMTRPEWLHLLAAAGTMALLILAFGTLYQWLAFFAGKSGFGMTLTAIVFAVVIPHWAGFYFELPWIASFSPSYHFGRWLFDTQFAPNNLMTSGGRSPALISSPYKPAMVASLLPMVASYAGVLLVIWYSLRLSMRKLERMIDNKLVRMGAIAKN